MFLSVIVCLYADCAAKVKERAKAYTFPNNDHTLVILKRNAGFNNISGRPAHDKNTGLSCYKHRQHYLVHRERPDYKDAGTASCDITDYTVRTFSSFYLSASRLISFEYLPRPAYYTDLFRYVLF